MKKIRMIILFVAASVSGVVLMSLGGIDLRSDFPVIIMNMEGWMYSYQNRFERALFMKRKIRLVIALQVLSGIIFCIVPFYSDNPVLSRPFWLAFIGAILWTVFSFLMTCAMYDAD